MRSAFIATSFALSLGPTMGFGQSLSAMDKATTQCFSEVPDSDNLHVVIKHYSDRTTLNLQKQPGVSDATMRAYRACVESKVGVQVAPVVAEAPASDHAEDSAATAPKRVSKQVHRPKNPLCPDYASVMFRGSTYCVRNPT